MKRALKEIAVGAVVWSAMRSWGERGISFLVFLVLVRLVEPEAFGLVALASVVVGVLGHFLDQGLGEAIVQRSELEPEHLDTAFWIGMGTAGVLVLACIVSSGSLARAFGEPRLTLLMRALSVVLVLRALCTTQRDLLRRQLAFRALALRSLLSAVAGGVVGVVMAWRGAGAWSLVGQALTHGLCEVAVLWAVSDWRPGWQVSRRHFRDLFGFSVYALGAKAVAGVHHRFPDFVIGAALGPVALGYYVVAFRVVRFAIAVLTGATGAVAFPLFAQLQAETDRLRRAFYRATQLTILVTLPAFLGLSLVASEGVQVILGSRWLLSVELLQILSLEGILQSTMTFNGGVFKASGRPAWQFGIRLASTVATACAVLVAVQWGLAAVAAAYVGVGYVVAPASLLMVRRLIAIDLGTYGRMYLAPLGGSLAMVASVVAARSILDGQLSPEAQLSALVVVGAAAYGLVLQSVAPALLGEARALARMALPLRV